MPRLPSPLLLLILVAVPACRPANVGSEATEDAGDVRASGPVVRVQASYPGADARVVAETVVAPLFKEIQGVEGAVAIESEARNDGSCQITVRFAPKTDPALAQVLVQNRVALTNPALPDVVQQIGTTLDHRDPDRPPALAVVVRGGAKDDALLLAGIARGPVTDAIARLAGVDDARAVGPAARIRVILDPDKLAARTLTATDITSALEAQNLRVEAGQFGRPVPDGRNLAITVSSAGRSVEPDQLGGVVVKTVNGKLIRLGDVARVEIGVSTGGFARLNGEATALVLASTRDDEPAVEKVRKSLADIPDLPAGVRAELFADLRSPALVSLVELQLPAGASRERVQTTADRATKLIRAASDKADVLAYSDGVSSTATLLVKATGDGPTPADVRKALTSINEAVCRVTDVTAGRTPFPVRVALVGEQDEKLRAWADAVAQRLAKDAAAIDAAVWPGPPVPHTNVEVDRAKAQKLGVNVRDIAPVLQEFLQGPRADGATEVARLDEFKTLKIRSTGREMVPLASVVTFRMAIGPDALWSVNGKNALRLSADPPAGKSPAATAARCVEIATEEHKRLALPVAYRVLDLTRAGDPR